MVARKKQANLQQKVKQEQSLDFVVNRFLMKLFKTSNYEIICECRNYLCFCLPSELLAKRHNVFVSKLNSQ